GRRRKGHDQRLRVQRLPPGGRGGALRPPGRQRGGRARGARSGQGRGGAGLRRGAPGPRRHRRRARRALSRPRRPLQGPGRRRLPGRLAQESHRKNPQEGASRMKRTTVALTVLAALLTFDPVIDPAEGRVGSGGSSGSRGSRSYSAPRAPSSPVAPSTPPSTSPAPRSSTPGPPPSGRGFLGGWGGALG